MPAERVLREESHGWVVIGTRTGREVVLRSARLQGDSLVVGSWVESVGDYPRPPDLVSIRLDDVVWIATAETDRVAEAKVIANVVAIAGFAVAVPFIALLVVGIE